MKQLRLLKAEPSAYGGELLKTRKGRSRARPLATKSSMHLVLRSSRAKGEWSFRRPKHQKRIQELVKKFSQRYGVRILSFANVGNHLHLQVQLTRREAYRPFIRALTGAIAMAISGVNRWTAKGRKVLKFWDYRPFTRVVMGFRALLTLRDYIRINQMEGEGVNRDRAVMLIKRSFSSA